MAQPEAAVAILRARRPEEAILLMRRSEREDDPWSGHWSLPGGRRDAADTDLLDTAIRELEEECGIRLGRSDMESALDLAVARRRTGPYVPVAPFVFGIAEPLPTVLDPREAADALWVPLALLRDPQRHILTPVPGLPEEIAFPAIELNGIPLWGFTYRLLTNWLDLIPKQKPVEQHGLEAANAVLEFLLSRGLTLNHGWIELRGVTGSRVEGPVSAAEVSGPIPVHAVAARFIGNHRSSLTAGQPWRTGVPPINALEVRPDYIRVAGLAFEEYFIYASR